MQAMSSPVSGVLGDKYDRTHIIALGCFLWGIMTTAIGLSTSIYQVCSHLLPFLSILCTAASFLRLFAVFQAKYVCCHILPSQCHEYRSYKLKVKRRRLCHLRGSIHKFTCAAVQAMIWCAINGVGLALVIPCIQSLIADYNPAEKRGSAFGMMFFISAMGTNAPLLHRSNHLQLP